MYASNCSDRRKFVDINVGLDRQLADQAEKRKPSSSAGSISIAHNDA